MTKPGAVPRDILFALRELVRCAVRTLYALTDPDAKYRGYAKLPVNVVHDLRDAYGYSAPRVRRFQPSPRQIDQMDIILPWLAWLRRNHSDLAMRRIIGWALAVPLWRLAQRETCSEKTIINRIDRSLVLIAQHVAGRNLQIEYIDEPVEQTPVAVILDPPNPTSNGQIQAMKIYIGGRGMWHNGRWIRPRPHRRQAQQSNFT